MIEVDGSIGEGGGQILRTALALSMLTAQAIRIRNIRARRRRPGLQRQHLAAVNAAAEISSAKVKGAELGSSTLKFSPSAITPGQYTFSIGSAGSTSLVLQTVLPALISAEEPSTVFIEGGTHNPMAPPFEFLQQSFIPLLSRMGPQLSPVLERPGFYPAGGGRFKIHISPAERLLPLDLRERGEIKSVNAQALIAGLDRSIAQREIKIIRRELELSEEQATVRELGSKFGPGNVVLVSVSSAALTAVFTGFGEKHVRAETVAAGVCAQANAYLRSAAAVDRLLADQLLLPFALAGSGSFSTLEPSSHTRTNIEIIRLFLDIDIRAEERPDGCWELSFNRAEK